MAKPDLIDLGKIDPAIWIIRVARQVYGPYTLGQMQAFYTEGRLRQDTEVARGQGGAYRQAHAYPALKRLFEAVPQTAKPHQALNALRAGDQTGQNQARPQASMMRAENPEALSQKPAPTASEGFNYMIAIRMSPEGKARLAALLNAVGPFFEILPNIFLLHTHQNIANVQVALATCLSPQEKAVIVNATQNRLAWIGLEPGVNRHVAGLWQSQAALKA